MEKFQSDFLVVTHARGVIGVAQRLLRQPDFFSSNVTCSLTKISGCNNDFALELSADASHLRELNA